METVKIQLWLDSHLIHGGNDMTPRAYPFQTLLRYPRKLFALFIIVSVVQPPVSRLGLEHGTNVIEPPLQRSTKDLRTQVQFNSHAPVYILFAKHAVSRGGTFQLSPDGAHVLMYLELEPRAFRLGVPSSRDLGRGGTFD